MKLRKILSAAAAAVMATTTVAVAASAADFVLPGAPESYVDAGTKSWMIKLFVAGDIDLGIDGTKIGSVTVKFSVPEEEQDWFTGGIGGCVVYSCGPATACPADHNWISASWWGVDLEDGENSTIAPDKDLTAVRVGPYSYEVTAEMNDDNCIYQEAYDAPDGYVQIAFQNWAADEAADWQVDGLVIKDKSGAVMASFDANGKRTDAAPAPADPAPADPDKPATPADPDKGNPNTGVEGVAAAAGVAVLAAGAVVLSKKRK